MSTIPKGIKVRLKDGDIYTITGYGKLNPNFIGSSKDISISVTEHTMPKYGEFRYLLSNGGEYKKSDFDKVYTWEESRNLKDN